MSSLAARDVIASAAARSARMIAFTRCVAAASIAGGGSATFPIGCGPITLPRSPRSGIAVLRAHLRDRRLEIGHVAPRRALVGDIFDRDDQPLAVRLAPPSKKKLECMCAGFNFQFRDEVSADSREAQRLDCNRVSESRDFSRGIP